MVDNLGTFPVDDATLDLLDAVLAGRFRMSEVLDFLSGYDPARCVDIGGGVSEYLGVIYSQHDVIRALIDEVRRLRS